MANTIKKTVKMANVTVVTLDGEGTVTVPFTKSERKLQKLVGEKLEIDASRFIIKDVTCETFTYEMDMLTFISQATLV